MDQGYFAAEPSANDIGDEVASEIGSEPGPAVKWLTGRLVRVCHDAGCGFIRAAGGALVYFAFGDAAEGARGLRPSARVRYQLAGTGIPKAMAVAAV